MCLCWELFFTKKTLHRDTFTECTENHWNYHAEHQSQIHHRFRSFSEYHGQSHVWQTTGKTNTEQGQDKYLLIRFRIAITGNWTFWLVESKQKICITFFVIKGGKGCFLSYATAKTLGLINIVQAVNSSNSQFESENLRKELTSLFEGVGKLKYCQVHFGQCDPLHKHKVGFHFTWESKLKMNCTVWRNRI